LYDFVFFRHKLFIQDPLSSFFLNTFSNDRLSTLVDHIITRTFRSSPNQSLAMHQRAVM